MSSAMVIYDILPTITNTPTLTWIAFIYTICIITMAVIVVALPVSLPTLLHVRSVSSGEVLLPSHSGILNGWVTFSFTLAAVIVAPSTVLSGSP